MENLRSTAGTIGYYLLALFLVFFGFSGLAGLAIPAWVGFLLALLAGAFLFVGR